MAVQTVYLLPGQGGYTPGMFADRDDDRLTEALRTADRVAAEFGRPGVSGLLTRTDAPSAAELVREDPFALQLAVFTAAVGGYRTAGPAGPADALVGHSMGEIAALTLAGAFDPVDGARLVCHRAEALLAHYPGHGGMLALELSADRAAHLVGAAADRALALAVVNAPRQSVVAGPDDSVALVARLAEALGVRTIRLNAPYPFHSPGLAAAAHDFRERIVGIRQLPLRHAVYSPVAGGWAGDRDDLKELLVRQLTAPVRFLDAVRALHAEGVERFVECGRAGLSGLVRRSVPDVTVASALSAVAEPVVAEPVVAEPVVAAPAVAEPVVAAPVGVEPAAAAGLGLEEVVAQLRELFAVTLGYPVEMVTADADLEADLGIDSLKRVEMLAKVAERFGLGESIEPGRFIARSTLAEVAELVLAAPAFGQSAAAPAVAATVVAEPAAVEPAVAAGLGLEEVVAQLRELFAVTLGYPVEMVTADADLEADLGIDSLKRVEMLAKVAERFGLGESIEPGRFIAQSTLADVAELVLAAPAFAS
ncbi:ACP S-malonyltransferase [Kitasatospora cathayae]|uniref:Phosphopantetheine-binding protein n=1 Tax=Kitasatospora cathayae TaxID=3004092 RepID=A0ABY7Q0H0_9ACTN|nr:phosphopantetheine-binding protein [Kitasatospora sp. HUAS 3-15]WBP86158.1 phosphopantetheine-binding protein [Kitasatospora sp. HUAS 3-15]